jgi:hypothetical protein
LAAFLDKPCDVELAKQIAEKCSFANLKNAEMNIKKGGDKNLYRKGQHLIHLLKRLQGIPSIRHDIKQFVISLPTLEKKIKKLICFIKILVLYPLKWCRCSFKCKTNTIPILMHQMRISTT